MESRWMIFATAGFVIVASGLFLAVKQSQISKQATVTNKVANRVSDTSSVPVDPYATPALISATGSIDDAYLAISQESETAEVAATSEEEFNSDLIASDEALTLAIDKETNFASDEI